MSAIRQTPLTCPGHTRPVVHLHYSNVTSTGYYLISASKGKPRTKYLAVHECHTAVETSLTETIGCQMWL